ncbi:MAG: antitoxin [Nitrospirae bacterium]|nr:antitoxin [Nitrospirota bacterium]
MNKLKFFDDEEKKLIKSLEKEEWVSDFNKEIKKEYQEYAKQSLSKQKRINIRMTERDLKKIQVKALQEGLPYQSLISMLIHKFNEGELSFGKKKHA